MPRNLAHPSGFFQGLIAIQKKSFGKNFIIEIWEIF